MTGTVTLGSVLHDAAERLQRAGIKDSQLEADVLLRHALGMDDDRAYTPVLLHEPIDAVSAVPDAWIEVRQGFAGLDCVLCIER